MTDNIIKVSGTEITVVAQGMVNNCISSSYAATASVLLGSVPTASLAVSASYALTASYAGGVVTSASFAVTASAITFVPATASLALNAQAAVSSSFATTASAASSLTFVPSLATSASLAANAQAAVSASYATIAGQLNFTPTASSALTATTSSYATVAGQLNFTPTASSAVSSSFALTASAATSITFQPASASYAVTASWSDRAASLMAGNYRISGSLQVSGNIVQTPGFAISASAFSGSGVAIVGVVSASYAVTSSYASIAQAVLNNPTSASYATTSSYASVAQTVLGAITSASFAQQAATLMAGNQLITGSLLVSGAINNAGYSVTATSFIGDGSQVTGVISASEAIVAVRWANGNQQITGSLFISGNVKAAGFQFSGSFAGDGTSVLNVVSSSYAVTASYAANGGVPVSASYALTASAATSITFVPALATAATTATTASFISVTDTFSILQNVMPDSSSDCFAQPASILLTNDRWDRLIYRFGASNVANPTLKAGLAGGFQIPDSFLGNSFVVIDFTSTVTSGNAIWSFEYLVVSGNNVHTIDTNLITETIAFTGSAAAAAGNRVVVSQSLAGPFLPGCHVLYRLQRDGTAGADTIAGSAILLNAQFRMDRK